MLANIAFKQSEQENGVLEFICG